jgi:8-hydroxy-5-deazaflavin:NADPH oxidoreductase
MQPASVSRVAILGGTGPQGRGLAVRFAGAGIDVAIGSRDADRARAAVDDVAAAAAVLAGRHEVAVGAVRGGGNDDVVDGAEVVVLAVPWDAHASTLQALAPRLTGALVVDCVNPLGFDERGPFALTVPEGSAAQQAQALLPTATVVGAFHHVSAVVLLDVDQALADIDVLVLGDDREATDRVRALADAVPGMRGVFAGRLRNTGQVEALTGNLIAINRRYKTHASVRIAGL